MVPREPSGPRRQEAWQTSHKPRRVRTRAREVLQAWRDWLPSLPDEVTSIGRLLQVPPFPHLPEAFRGRRLVAVEAAMLRGQDAGAGLLRPLRALRPEIDTVAAVPPLALSHLHMDPEGPVPAGSASTGSSATCPRRRSTRWWRRPGPADPRDFFPAATYRRLQRVKGEVDPGDLFLAIHPIPARATCPDPVPGWPFGGYCARRRHPRLEA
jgi:hypothetical protein